MSPSQLTGSTRLTNAVSSIQKLLYHPAAGFVVLFSSLVLTGLAWHFSLEYSNHRASDKFATQVDEIESAILQRMDEYARLLQAGVALHNASDSVNRDEWKAFVSALSLSKNYKGTQGIGVSVPIRPEELQSHIQSIRAEGFPEYTVRPPGPREFYTSIVLLEPFDWRNQRAFGFDMYSEAMRRAAMDRAIATGQPSISGRVTLVQETDKDVQAGFLMYLPIYSDPLALTAGQEERSDKHTGFVYAVLRGGDLMKNILNNIGDDVSLQIFDAEPSDSALLYQSRSETTKSESFGLAESRRIDIYGQQWVFLVRGDVGDAFTGEYWQSTLVGLFGLLIDFLLFYTIHLIGKQRRVADHKTYTMNLERANTKLHRANIGLEKSNAALEKSNDDLTQFAYSASHDLKSPLRAICTLAGFVLDDSRDQLSDLSVRHLNLLQSRTTRLNRLLDDMMEYACIESDSSKNITIDMQALCTEVISLIDVPDDFDIVTDIEMPMIQASALPLQQVILNLITNAIKHHDQARGNVEIHARWSDGHIDCVVSDNGPGIPEEFRVRVFEMFKMLQSRDQREGSGMGLAIVKKLVESNGGVIGVVASKHNARGTSFHFSWPAKLDGASVSGTGLPTQTQDAHETI